MKDKGYTLIELLGVMIILAVLIAFVVPSIINFVKSSTEDKDKLTNDLIINAAQLYIKSNPKEFIKFNGGRYVIYIQDLIDLGNLPDSVNLSDIGNINDKCLQVNYNNDTFNYKLADKKKCENYLKICEGTTSLNVTTGNIPEGEFAIGDEYICEVKPNTKYHFFVLGVEGDIVNLILDRNINSDGTLATEGIADKTTIYNLTEWITESDYGCSEESCAKTDKGPITIFNFIDEATKDWVYISNLNEVFSKTGEMFQNFKITSKARIPNMDDVRDTGCGPSTNTCPLWMINYLWINDNYSSMNGASSISGLSGYWLLSSIAETSARHVSSAGSWSNIPTSTATGVRPVIQLTKEDTFIKE